MLCISLYLRGNQEAAQPGLIIRTISPDVSRHELPSYPASQLLTLSGVPGQLQLLRARRGGGAVCRGGGDVDEDLAAALVRDLDTGQAWARGHSLYTLVMSRYLHFSTLTCVHLVETQLGLGGSCGGQQGAGEENVLN